MSSSTLRPRLVLLACYFVAQLLFVFAASDALLLRVDDTYYYFGIAWHVVDSGRFTFDGIHLTNGFQPLWQFVLIAVTALFRLVGVTDKDSALRLYFVVCALLNTLSAWLALGLGDRIFGSAPRARQIFAFFIFWFPGLTFSLLAGMESAVNWPLLLTFFRLITDGVGRPTLAALPRRQFAGAVAVSVLLVYARLDNAIILAITVIYLWLRERNSASIRRGLVWGAVVVACWAPLLAWGQHLFASPTPVSGAVKMWNTRDFIAHDGVATYVRTVVEGVALSALGLPISALGMGYYEILKPIVMKLGFSRVIGVLGLTAAIAGLGLARLLQRTRPPARDPMPPLLPLLAVISAIHLSMLVTLFPDQWMYAGIIWYDLVEYLCLFVLIAWLGGWLLQMLQPATWRGLVVAAQIAIFLSVIPTLLWRPQKPTEGQIHRMAAQWMNEHLPDSAVVASHDAGAMGFFARASVINLDGLVNNRDYLDHYLRPHHKRQYLDDAKVGYLADINCPYTPKERWRSMLHLPADGTILLRIDGNEHDLTFCIVELRR